MSVQQQATSNQQRVTRTWRKAWAFFVRDLRIEAGYPVALVLRFADVFFSSFLFYFLARLIGGAADSLLAPYGGDYFAFVIIGVAFAGYFSVGLSSFARNLREAQTTGTLEAMLLTPTRLSTVVLSSGLWDYSFTTLRVVVYFLLGVLVFGMDMEGGNYLAALVILALTIVSFSALGILAASFIMVLKRGDPVTWLFTTVFSLLGGVYYPVELLPRPLRLVAELVPVTPALRAMRLALLQGAGWDMLGRDVLALVGFCLLLLPVGLYGFRYAVRHARVDGSLAHY
ncbi:MAG TPA: ABC transporter permease [Anaerolineae bacterium]|nr:ABC transporter permease [Anaerolineae bacterium]HIQ06489.1 ABC transporter permease [Anaerolineae bacterium]